MQQGVIQDLVRQLAVQASMLLALAVLMVLALVMWRRHPTACLAAFLGALVLFMTSVVQMYVTAHVVRTTAAPARGSIADTLMVVAITANAFRAAGIGLLTWAVFAGRRTGEQRGFPMSAPPPLPAGPGAGAHPHRP